MRIVIRGEFVTLNEYILAERTNRHMAAKIKRDSTEIVKYATLGVLPVEKYPIHIKFHWFWKNTRPDPDNVAFCKKYLLDGLQESRVIEGDRWKHVCGGFEDIFSVDAENPRVEIEIESLDPPQDCCVTFPDGVTATFPDGVLWKPKVTPK